MHVTDFPPRRTVAEGLEADLGGVRPTAGGRDDPRVSVRGGERAGLEGREKELGKVEVAEDVRAPLHVVSFGGERVHRRVHDATVRDG